mmetsp:Transcript_35461/g.34501  ORF Transcript_35461/g.34501 Transcript_35461/m.34501 type:complete len:118 (+) Transcript_35461:1115-1468(+)
MNTSYQEIFQITKTSNLVNNIVRENVLEEDEDMISERGEGFSREQEKEEEEKGEKHNKPYPSVVPQPSNAKDKLQRKKFDFLYKRTAFRFMGDFYKLMFSHCTSTKKVSKKLQKLTT